MSISCPRKLCMWLVSHKEKGLLNCLSLFSSPLFPVLYIRKQSSRRNCQTADNSWLPSQSRRRMLVMFCVQHRRRPLSTEPAQSGLYATAARDRRLGFSENSRKNLVGYLSQAVIQSDSFSLSSFESTRAHLPLEWSGPKRVWTADHRDHPVAESQTAWVSLRGIPGGLHYAMDHGQGAGENMNGVLAFSTLTFSASLQINGSKLGLWACTLTIAAVISVADLCQLWWSSIGPAVNLGLVHANLGLMVDDGSRAEFLLLAGIISNIGLVGLLSGVSSTRIHTHGFP